MTPAILGGMVDFVFWVLLRIPPVVIVAAGILAFFGLWRLGDAKPKG